MLVPKIEVKIEGMKTWVFDKVISCEIELNSESLTDTCVLKLPKKVKWDDEAVIPIKRGDKIEIKLGYDNELTTRFVGYVRSVGTKSPVEIQCDDMMYMLKSTPCKPLAYRTVTLDKLLKDQLPADVELKVHGDQEIGQFRVSDANVSDLLSRLMDSGIKSFFKLVDGKAVLWSGVVFESNNGKVWKFESGVNVIKNETEYQCADYIKIKVTATSIMPNNERIEVEVGDSDGEARTMQKYNVGKSELEKWANDELAKIKCDGLTGSIETFGVPEVDKRDKIYMKVDDAEGGVYQVKKVIVSYGTGGYRQKIELNNKLS